jgi:hypothetical protein
MSKTKVLHAPYTKGNLQDWVPVEYPDAGNPRYGLVEWRENTPFNALLKYRSFERGHSAARTVWEDSEGHTYPMFMTDLDSLLKNEYGVVVETSPVSVDGQWIVSKRGQNYGIRLFGRPNDID